jgi:ADP-heptose:LPS heptosyltransferase
VKRFLVLRFSSLGDVVLCLPAMKALLDADKDAEIVFVTRKRFVPYFEHIDRLIPVGIDLDNKQKRALRLLSWVRQAYETYGPFDKVIDLHDNMRSLLFKTRLALKGVSSVTYTKGRKAKKALIRSENRNLTPLTHTSQRYLAAIASVTNVQ